MDGTITRGGRVRIYPEVFRRILEEHFGGTVKELAEVVRYRDFGETEERREFFDSLIREGGVLTVEQVERLARKKAGNSDTA